MHISGVDLNLIASFEALLEERHVSRAARRVGLSQPAMSHALGRLRALFGDPLFVRSARGITPTPRAVELARSVRGAMDQLRALLGGPVPFDPSTAQRRFVVAANDYAEVTVLAPVLRRLAKEAPGIEISIRRVEQLFREPEGDLAEGGIDVAIGFYSGSGPLLPQIHEQLLFEEEHVVLTGGTAKRIPFRVYAEAEHVAVFYRMEGPGLIDRLLEERGAKRRVAVAAPHFLSIPFLVAGTDRLATVPAGLYEIFRGMKGLHAVPVPFEMPVFGMRLLWHQRTQQDPAHMWLRGQLSAVREGTQGTKRR
jgi:DNA-binding transcriptional LysR family regulator